MLTVKKALPMIGTIQGMFARAVQPYQNRQRGSVAAPKKVGSSTVSGLKFGLVKRGTRPYLIQSMKQGRVMMPPTKMPRKARPWAPLEKW